MTAAEERHEKAMRELKERRRKAVDEAVDQLVYDLGRTSDEAWSIVDKLRSLNAALILSNRSLEQRVADLEKELKQQPAAPAKEG